MYGIVESANIYAESIKKKVKETETINWMQGIEKKKVHADLSTDTARKKPGEKICTIIPKRMPWDLRLDLAA